MNAEPRVGRGAAVGAVVGFVVIGTLGAVAGLASGVEAIGAVGLGLFVGVWGGVGFGSMMGACIAAYADEAPAQPREAPERRTRPDAPAVLEPLRS